MNVVLYKVGRNLNRAYRTSEAFGVSELMLLECAGVLTGNLFSANDRVHIRHISEWPSPNGLLALETFYQSTIFDVDWSTVNTILIGGETSGLPRITKAQQCATIPMFGNISGLTVEAALAIALHEWRKNDTY